MNRARSNSHLHIGQLAGELGLNPKTIRYYETVGPLPASRRSAAGYRLHVDTDRDSLRFVEGDDLRVHASRDVMPSLTTEEQRLAASSVAWSTGRLVQLRASVLAGRLMAYVGTSAAFGLSALTILVSAILIARLRIPASAGQLAAQTKRGISGFLREARAEMPPT